MNTINNFAKTEEDKFNVIELKESDDENSEQIHLEEEEEQKSSDLSSSNLNKSIKKDKILNYEFTSEISNAIPDKPKKTINFEESLDYLKDNFTKLFNKEGQNNTQIYIWDNKKFRSDLNTNKNMKLIFKFSDIIKDIYENQFETKIIEKNCDINRIIDIYIKKIKKYAQKRRIVVKDYKNLIYVIGAEMQVNKLETQAKEFIVKKRTQTLKGNNKIKSNNDDCYLMEINNNKKKKQIFFDLGQLTGALVILVQNFEKNAVFK